MSKCCSCRVRFESAARPLLPAGGFLCIGGAAAACTVVFFRAFTPAMRSWLAGKNGQRRNKCTDRRQCRGDRPRLGRRANWPDDVRDLAASLYARGLPAHCLPICCEWLYASTTRLTWGRRCRGRAHRLLSQRARLKVAGRRRWAWLPQLPPRLPRVAAPPDTRQRRRRCYAGRPRPRRLATAPSAAK